MYKYIYTVYMYILYIYCICVVNISMPWYIEGAIPRVSSVLQQCGVQGRGKEWVSHTLPLPTIPDRASNQLLLACDESVVVETSKMASK